MALHAFRAGVTIAVSVARTEVSAVAAVPVAEQAAKVVPAAPPNRSPTVDGDARAYALRASTAC